MDELAKDNLAYWNDATAIHLASPFYRTQDFRRGENILDPLVRAGIGEVGEPILGRQAKLTALREETAALGIDLSQSLAVGDGANDLAMIEAAGLGVAYRAKPVVAARADARVDRCDLTALLYFQGYKDDEFVA